MKEYQRNTKVCNFTDFPAETIQAFRKYFEKNELGKVEAEIVMCCETDSTRIKQGFFEKLFGGSNFAHQTAVFFTPNKLFWCTTDRKNQQTVLSAKLREIEIKDFASRFVEDSGLEVFGLISQFPERATAFIGMGEETAAQEFKRRLKETVNAAN